MISRKSTLRRAPSRRTVRADGIYVVILVKLNYKIYTFYIGNIHIVSVKIASAHLSFCTLHSCHEQIWNGLICLSTRRIHHLS